MKTIKYIFATLLLSTLFIACEADTVAEDETVIESVEEIGGGIDADDRNAI